jgi:phosphatidylglycerophosphate synthase
MKTHNTQAIHPPQLARLPNSISLLRVLSIPVLLYLAFAGHASAFAALYVLALCSDLADGWLARRLGVVSPTGALLDSVADILLTLAVLCGIWLVHPAVYQADGRVIYTVVGAWLLAHCASLWRYGRLASFHTWLIRIGIGAFHLFALVLFVLGYQPSLLYLAGFLSLLGVVEHFVLLAALPQWTPDIPGGIFHLLRHRRSFPP